MQFTPEIVCRIVFGLIVVAMAAIGVPGRLRADRAGGKVSRRADPRWFWSLMAVAGPPVALVCIAFMLQPRWVDFAAIGLPPWSRLLGAPIGFAGVALFGWMFRHLGLNVTPTSTPREGATLVTTGPYKWVRHPMYSAALVLVVAAILLTANGVVLTGGLAMFALLAARTRVEERRLVEKFGESYQTYERRTGRFFPRWPARDR